MNRKRISVFAVSGGLLVVAAAITLGQTAASGKSEEETIDLRDRIVQKHMRIIKGVREDAEFLTTDQERALKALAAYRAPEAASEIVRIITVKSPVKLGPLRILSGGGLGRERRGGEYLAAGRTCDHRYRHGRSQASSRRQTPGSVCSGNCPSIPRGGWPRLCPHTTEIGSAEQEAALWPSAEVGQEVSKARDSDT